MKSAASIAVFLPLLAGLVLVTVPTHAPQRGQERPERSERLAERGAENPRAQRRQDSMAESIRHVRRANRGHIIAADRMHSNGRQINRIKLVDDRGRVRVIEDDPQRRRGQRSRRDDD